MEKQKLDLFKDFTPEIQLGEYLIKYINPMKDEETGLWIGFIEINGELISSHPFIGSILVDDNKVYTVIGVNKGCFIIQIILTKKLTFNYIGSIHKVIYLEKIENHKIYFFTDELKQNHIYEDLNDCKISNPKDSPQTFHSEIRTDLFCFQYSNTYSINKKTKVGNFSINGSLIKDYLFGAPFLYNESYVYIPVFMKKWWKSYFQLARINLLTNEIRLLNEKQELIYLKEMQNNCIYFHPDIEKRKTFVYENNYEEYSQD